MGVKPSSEQELEDLLTARLPDALRAQADKASCVFWEIARRWHSHGGVSGQRAPGQFRDSHALQSAVT
jgi:hypothetical protein